MFLFLCGLVFSGFPDLWWESVTNFENSQAMIISNTSFSSPSWILIIRTLLPLFSYFLGVVFLFIYFFFSFPCISICCVSIFKFTGWSWTMCKVFGSWSKVFSFPVQCFSLLAFFFFLKVFSYSASDVRLFLHVVHFSECH